MENPYTLNNLIKRLESDVKLFGKLTPLVVSPIPNDIHLTKILPVFKITYDEIKKYIVFETSLSGSLSKKAFCSSKNYPNNPNTINISEAVYVLSKYNSSTPVYIREYHDINMSSNYTDRNIVSIVEYPQQECDIEDLRSMVAQRGELFSDVFLF